MAKVKISTISLKLLRLSFLISFLILTANGCTRRYFRTLADKEANAVLAEKERHLPWKLSHFHVGPHPEARFANNYNPDRPPMPPDDPAASALAPRPQTPYLAGVGRVEGTGYLQILEKWDAENRASAQFEKGQDSSSSAPYAKSAGQIPVSIFNPKVRLFVSDPKLMLHAGAGGSEKAPLQLVAFNHEQEDKSPGKKGREKLPPPDSFPQKPEILDPPKKLDIDPQAHPLCARQTPYLITLDQAVALGILNSREFQNRREDLYLNALPVTLQRFSFAAQFFFTEQAVRERLGAEVPGGKIQRWTFDTGTGLTKLFSSGALLALQFANQTIINLSGDGPHTFSVSDINLDVAQPFLRGGGKAVTLEPLTQVERNLVYEIRSYARFQKEFFVAIAAGDNVTAGNAPGFGGGVGVGSIAGVRSSPIGPGGAGRVILATGQGAPGQGYLPTLLAAAQLENEKRNVEALKTNLDKIRQYEKGGTIQKLQVDQVELDLLQSNSTVLQLEQNLKTALDQLKQQLGLPVNVPIELDNAPIRPMIRQMARYEQTFALYKDIMLKASAAVDKADVKKLRQRLKELFRSHPIVIGTKLAKDIFPQWNKWEKKTDAEIEKERKARYDLMKKLADLLAKHRSPRGQTKADQQELKKNSELLARLRPELALVELEYRLRLFEKEAWKGIVAAIKIKDKKERDKRLQVEFEKISNSIVSGFGRIIIIGPRAERLTRINNTWPELPPLVVGDVDLLDAGLKVAQNVVVQEAIGNRLDLMNARAQVVDAWRQIAIFANSLLGVFNVRYHIDSSTPLGKAQPLNFDSARTRHQLIFNAELPLVRKSERNNYRASLIAFERARRALMAAEDSVAASVRNQIRQLHLLAENYKLQKRSVSLAYPSVENAEEELFAPPAPGQIGLTSASGFSLTNQFLGAQRQLVGSQNAIYQVWINYLTTRLQLYRDLERMQINPRGVWIDEHASRDETLSTQRISE